MKDLKLTDRELEFIIKEVVNNISYDDIENFFSIDLERFTIEFVVTLNIENITYIGGSYEGYDFEKIRGEIVRDISIDDIKIINDDGVSKRTDYLEECIYKELKERI